MGAGDLELLDLLYTQDGDDEPRLKVGDAFSNKGVGADCAYLATDGFISQPIAPDGTGACAQAVVWTPGNDRIVIACTDNRYNGKAGTMSPGDRAIVSNCDACFKLTQAANKIQFLATAENMEITLDAESQLVKLIGGGGNAQCTLGPSAISLVWNVGPSAATAILGSSGVAINFTDTIGNTCAVSLLPGGGIAITTTPGALGSPSGVLVNGTPLAVP